MKKRLKAALRTNETQIGAVTLMSLANLSAAISREGAPWWLYLVAVSLWPAFAFVSNFFDPIPE